MAESHKITTDKTGLELLASLHPDLVGQTTGPEKPMWGNLTVQPTSYGMLIAERIKMPKNDPCPQHGKYCWKLGFAHDSGRRFEMPRSWAGQLQEIP